MNWRHRIPEDPTPHRCPTPAPPISRYDQARRLLEEQMLRGRNKNDRTRARWLYVALIVGAA